MLSPPDSPDNSRLRFGIFEIDLGARELRRNGSQIRLQEQPLQVLAILLECHGQIVTREQLRERIWSADTFVDFDHSLNTAINKIREALGDSASTPRFVETLARRGYRFIGSVDRVDAATSHRLDRRNDSSSSVRAATIRANAPLHPDLHIPIPNRVLVRSLFGLIQIMYLIFYLNGLARLQAIDQIAGELMSARWPLIVVGVVLITGALGIPLRFYLLSAVAFDYRRLDVKFTQLFPIVLIFDQLWALTPFFLLHRIGAGLAFAATAALLYVPFSERTLIRMVYRSS